MEPQNEGLPQQQNYIRGVGKVIEPPEMKILIHALNGEDHPQTIKLQGTVKKNKITILVDSGSTHNFLDLENLELR